MTLDYLMLNQGDQDIDKKSNTTVDKT